MAAQVSTAGIPFGTAPLGDGTGGTVTSWIWGGAKRGFELRTLASAYFNVPSGLTVTIERTFFNPDNELATWTTIASGITNQDYSYVGPPFSGLRFTRTAGTGVILGTMSENPGVAGSASTSPMFVQGPAASGTTATGNPVKAGGVYNSSPITLTNGQVGDLQLDSQGFLRVREAYQAGSEDNTNNVTAIIERLLAGVSTYSPSIFTNFGANATLNVKAAAGNVHSIYCQNTNAAVRYIQLHNTTTTPAGGAVPVLSFMIPASGAVFIDHTMLVAGGAYFSLGVAFAYSTTAGTYTAGTAGEQNTTIFYK